MGRVRWNASLSDARQGAVAELRPGEKLERILPAVSPPPDTGSGGLAPALLVPLMTAVAHRQWRRDTHATAARSQFPLAPRMVVALTDERLLVWAASRRWQVRGLLGEVGRDRIVDAEAPTVGAGWRTVRIHVGDEPAVALRVPARTADDLAARLGRRA